MKNISIFCLTLNPLHENFIKKLSYIPVGLGKEKFSKEIFTDKKGINISHKNKYYGEYTFHYWLWKNYLDKIETEWIGFCQYRKFFIKKNFNKDDISFENLTNLVIKDIDKNLSQYDCILGDKLSVQNYKLSKILKNYLFNFIKKPSVLIYKKKRNLKLHFDLYHGEGNLDKAAELLDNQNKEGFINYMNNETAFNPHNMFICKTKKIIEYYEVIFPWLEKCENIFGFSNLKGYGLQRIYGFLAERFMSYWFNKNCKVKEFPIIGKDLSDYKNL